MNVLNFQHLHQQIKDSLFEISYKVSCFNQTGDIDISRYAEAYFKLIFNIIYRDRGWNFEKASKINQETYDLYDPTSKICVQITSNTRARKKIETIEKFKLLRDTGEFEKLILFFIANSKPKKAAADSSSFYEDFDVHGLCKLIENSCDQKQLLEIHAILKGQSDTENYGNKKTKAAKNKVSRQDFLKWKKMEKDLRQELVIPEYWNKIDHNILLEQPYRKFKDSRFILRSISDTSYPKGGEDAEWCRTFMYDFYERGILIDFGACLHNYAIIDGKRNWYVANFEEKDDEPKFGYTKEEIKILGKLPYQNIISWHDGDNYYNDYHLFCEFAGIDNSPYEDIIYLTKGNLGFYYQELHKEKKI